MAVEGEVETAVGGPGDRGSQAAARAGDMGDEEEDAGDGD